MKKILVVEDNNDVRENVCEILELDNYDVVSARDGKEGVVLAQKHHPDLILCDVMMPELDGFGMLKILRKNDDTAHIPFIFLTAKAEKTDYRKGMGLGADDYLTKPFDDTDLLEAIEIRLQKAAAQGNSSGIGNSLFAPELLENFLTEMAAGRETRTYQRKDPIYSEGGNPYWVFKILRGKVKISKTNAYGKELIYQVLTDGEMFGYNPVIREESYSNSAIAIEDSELALIPVKEFLEGILSDSKLVLYLLQKSSKSLRETNERLLEMAYGSVRSKVAKAILSACFVDEWNDCVVSLSREDLASLAGTAKETLIRTLSDFKSEKLIDIQGNTIRVFDRKELSDLPQ